MPKKVRVWFRRDRNRWYGEYWEFGRRHAKAFRTKADAMRWKRFVEYKFDAGEWRGIEGLDWSAATELFLDEQQARSAAATVEGLYASLAMFERLVGPLRTDLITTAHVTRFIEARRGSYIKGKARRDVSTQTINKDLRNLKQFFRWCAANRVANDNIRVDLLRITKRKFVPPADDVFAELFRLAKEQCPALHARMVIAVTTGLRRGAIERIGLGLTAPYRIDWETGLLLTLEIKTHEEKLFRLGPNTMQILRAYLLTLPDGTMKLFPDRWDGATRNVWERIRSQCGLPTFTFHNLRNMAASLLRARGFSDGDAKELLGHADMRTTQGYLGSMTENLNRAADALDALFAEGG